MAVSAITYGALTGPATGLLGSIAMGATSGALGSIASQGVGVITGLQDKFSFKGVAMAAVSGAVGGGLGKFAALSRLPVGEAGRIGGTLGKVGSFLGGSGFVSGAARGALGSVLSQGIGVATGLQSKFDFAGVAAGAVGGGVGNTLGGVFGGIQGGSLAYYATRTLTGMTAASAGAAVRSLIDGSSFGDNIIRVLPEVIGSTIGNAIVDGIALRSVSRDSDDGFVSRSGASGGNWSHFADPMEVGEMNGENVVVTGERMSWLQKRAYDLTGLLDRVGNSMLDYNPIILTFEAAGAVSRRLGATKSARAFDDGAVFSRSYLRTVAQAPAHALMWAGNAVTHPVTTMRDTAVGIAGTVHGAIMLDFSDVRDGFRQMRNEIRAGGPAVAERYGESAGRLVLGAGSIVVPALRGSSTARFGSVVERVAPEAAPVSPAAASARSVAQSPHAILLGRGVTDAGLRQSILNTGFNPALLAHASPITLTQFNKLFQGTLDAGKSFRGRLGNLSTRARTIEQAVEIDRLGTHSSI